MSFQFVTPRAKQELDELSPSDLHRVLETISSLSLFPLSAATAQIRGLPEVRRAVAGKYLIYYEYDAQHDTIIIYTIRHGRRRPARARDIFPKTS
jgi:mRNA-degrading endonuclease RelE of RelBE toxin-antitoxin system